MNDSGYTGPERRKGSVTKEDLESVRDKVEETEQHNHHRAVLTIGFLLLILVLTVLVVINTFVQAERNETTQQAIRESQYLVCEQSGNTLREQIRTEFIDLKRESLIPVYRRIARILPEDEVSRDILLQEVRRLEARIDTIQSRIPDADCLTLYPPLDGQTYAR